MNEPSPATSGLILSVVSLFVAGLVVALYLFLGSIVASTIKYCAHDCGKQYAFEKTLHVNGDLFCE